MQIDPFRLSNALILAPMAGVTDLPYRILCREFGADLTVAEMTSSDPRLRTSRRTLQRSDHRSEPEPRVAQIWGAEPQQMADAARFNVERGAQIVDINMGCPAKKVCRRAAGSALLRDEPLVDRILRTVVRAVDVPVTLKIRTGWDPQHRNAVRVAQIAAQAGISAISVHGRTRQCGFSGSAEYRTIRDVKKAVDIPVIANGDIDSPEKAKRVLQMTGADGIMVGRAALGRPWIFRDIRAFLAGAEVPPRPGKELLRRVVQEHLSGLYAFYGEECGVRIARKHVGWYLRDWVAAPADLVREFYAQGSPPGQQALVMEIIDTREDAA